MLLRLTSRIVNLCTSLSGGLRQEVVHARNRCKNRPLGDVVVQGLTGQPLTGAGLLELCYLGLKTGLQLNQRIRYRRS